VHVTLPRRDADVESVRQFAQPGGEFALGGGEPAVRHSEPDDLRGLGAECGE
jgi:hypothetical protein